MEAFLEVDPASDFSIDNLPYGVYSSATRGTTRRTACVALGDQVIDLAALQRAGLFSGPLLSKSPDCFQQVRHQISHELGSEPCGMIRSISPYRPSNSADTPHALCARAACPPRRQVSIAG